MKVVPVLLLPSVELYTVMVPEYVDADAPAGTNIVMGEAGRDVTGTYAKPAAIAAPSHVIEY